MLFFALFYTFYELKVRKKLISTSVQRAEHPFAVQNTLQFHTAIRKNLEFKNAHPDQSSPEHENPDRTSMDQRT